MTRLNYIKIVGRTRSVAVLVHLVCRGWISAMIEARHVEYFREKGFVAKFVGIQHVGGGRFTEGAF